MSLCRNDCAAMRKAVATQVLALFRFFFLTRASNALLLVSLFIRLGAFVDVGLSPAERAINQSGYFSGSGKCCNARPPPPGALTLCVVHDSSGQPSTARKWTSFALPSHTPQV